MNGCVRIIQGESVVDWTRQSICDSAREKQLVIGGRKPDRLVVEADGGVEVPFIEFPISSFSERFSGRVSESKGNSKNLYFSRWCTNLRACTGRRVPITTPSMILSLENLSK